MIKIFADSHLDIGNPEFYLDPFSRYDALREQAPISWSEQLQSWVVSSHSIVRAGLTDQRFSVRRRKTIELLKMEDRRRFRILENFYDRWLLLTDPPDHTTTRGVVQRFFTPAAVEKFENEVRHLSMLACASFKDRHEFDLISELVEPLAARIILNFIGLRTISSHRGVEWANSFFAFLINRNPTSEQAEGLQNILLELLQELEKAAKEKVGEGLIKQLAVNDDELEDAKIICASILVDGIAPLASLLGHSCYQMLALEDGWARLKSGGCMEAGEFDSIIRLNSPFQYIARRAREKLELGGQIIEAGQRVMFLIGAANRDPLEFGCPRHSSTPTGSTRHLAFGHGIHRCLGSSLGALVVRTVVPMIAQNFPDMRLAVELPRYRSIFAVRELESLLVTSIPPTSRLT